MVTLIVSVEEVSDRFEELVHAATHGIEVIIQRDGVGERVRLVTDAPVAQPKKKRIAGLGMRRGHAGWMAPDFNDPLPDSFWFGEQPSK